MTYQGERARPMASEKGRFFEVSKVRIGRDGHISNVLWGEVNAGSDCDVGPSVVATAAEVIDALHDGATVAAVFLLSKHHQPERAFLIVEQNDGREYISFAAASSTGRNLSDMDKLDD
jgi:hypothetical protein